MSELLQVACFTSTTTAAEVALQAALPMGSTQAESEQLLQQTAEACDVELRCGHMCQLHAASTLARQVTAGHGPRRSHRAPTGPASTVLSSPRRSYGGQLMGGVQFAIWRAFPVCATDVNPWCGCVAASTEHSTCER